MAKKSSKYCRCNNKLHSPSLHEKKCQPRGTTEAEVLVVGMFPGYEEAQKGRYFVGSSGRQLNRDLLAVGIPSDNVRFQNIAEYWPPGHKISKLTKEQRSAGIEALLSDIVENNYKVVVPVGDEPLQALTGHKGITKWRRSTLSLSEDFLAGRGGEMESQPIVIPTLHPSAVLRAWDFHILFQHDLKTVNRYLQGANIFPPARSLVIPSDDEYEESCESLIADLEADPTLPVAADIEVFQGELACIAFAIYPERSVCVHANDREVWKKILDLPNPVVWHNSMYDLTFLEARNGYKPNGTQHDTQLMWHAIYPELACSPQVGKSLALLVSLFTNENYYKDELNNWRKVADWDRFYTYGARDAAVTIEVFYALKNLLKRPVEEAYEMMLHMVPPFKDASIRGVKIDTKTKGTLAAVTKKKIDKLSSEIRDIVDDDNYNPNSWQQVKKFLKSVGVSVPNTQETTLVAKLTELRDSDKKAQARAFLEAHLEYKKLAKAYGTYYTFEHDKDGRLRPSWNVGGTETGRLSSSGSIIFEGSTNMQTIPRPARKFFVADKGYKIVHADLAQAEARIVAYIAGCDRLIEAFESGDDPYKRVASWMYNKSIDEIDYEERYIAKRCVLGLLYGMGWKTWMDQTNTDKGYKYMTAARAKELIELFFATFSEIREYHAWVEEELKRHNNLTTIFGRRRWFRKRYGKFTSGTLREAYDYLPQSMVPDIINIGILKLQKHEPEILLLGQIHDAWLGQAKEEGLDDHIAAIVEALSVPIHLINIHNESVQFTIPVDIEVGSNWGPYDEEDNPEGLKEL